MNVFILEDIVTEILKHEDTDVDELIEGILEVNSIIRDIEILKMTKKEITRKSAKKNISNTIKKLKKEKALIEKRIMPNHMDHQ